MPTNGENCCQCGPAQLLVDIFPVIVEAAGMSVHFNQPKCLGYRRHENGIAQMKVCGGSRIKKKMAKLCLYYGCNSDDGDGD